MNAVDTNILIYSIDARDPIKRARAIELIEKLSESDTIIPWQVACEVAAVLRVHERQGHFRGDCASAIRALRSCFPVVLPTHAVLDRSLEIQQRDQVSPWDALLIAACAEAGVTKLYTEDLQSQPSIHGVELVNPLGDA